MAANLICAREGPPPGVSSSFRKTVRISTHLSGCAVVFINSKRSCAPVSTKLAVNGSAILLLVVMTFFLCVGFARLVHLTSERYEEERHQRGQQYDEK